MAFTATKAYDNATNGFDETVEFKVLNCTNVDGNNNKFFCIELQKHPGTGQYRIFTQYGRLNQTSTYDLRGPSADFAEVRKEYDSIIKKKLRGKKIKEADGTVREEKYVEIDVVAPTVGSPNIRRKASVSGSGKNFRDVFATDTRYEPMVRKLLTQLLEENIHNITGLASVTVSNSGLETPLGPVTAEHIAKARAYLDQLRQIGQIDVRDATVRRLNTNYYSLIPHSFGSRITDSDMIADDSKLLQEFDLLEQMETAVKMSAQSQQDTAHVPDLGLQIEVLTDRREYDEIVQRVEKSRKHAQLNEWKVKQIYRVCNVKERARYRPRPTGPELDLFHGSKNANILSILLNGFYVPPVNAPHVTGRMFGNGVYGASAVTKSLNYSIGYWDGRRNRYDNTFVFITRFAMGKTMEVYQSMPSGLPRGSDYESIHAKAGPALANDEFIVPNVDQTTITHLIEFARN